MRGVEHVGAEAVVAGVAAPVIASDWEPMPSRYGQARQALVDATVALSSRLGFHEVTVAELSVVARVGPRTFYNYFADLPEAFLEACLQMHEDLRRAVRDAYDGAVPGRARAVACVEAVVAFVRADPVRARVLFVEGYAGGPAVAELRAETVGRLIGLVGDGTEPGGPGPSGIIEPGGTGAVGGSYTPTSNPRRLLAELAVGGIGGVLYSRIKADDLDGLEGLVPSFVETLMRVDQARSAICASGTRVSSTRRSTRSWTALPGSS